MRVNVILRYVGMIMLLLAFFMFVSAGISYVNYMDSAFYPLLLSALLTALLGGFPLIFVEKQDRITNKEGFCIVVGSWLLACVVGMFPYLIWGGEFSVINAWFETVSGFTTTGSSICKCRGAAPGIAVLADVLDLGRRYGRGDVRAGDPACTGYQQNDAFECRDVHPGPGQLSLQGSDGGSDPVVRLCRTYDIFHFHAEIRRNELVRCRMSFDVGLCDQRVRNQKYQCRLLRQCDDDTVLIFAMGISGIHFGLIYATVTGKRNNIFRSEVTLFYLGMLILGSLLIALSLYIADIYPTFWSSLRFASFQFVSVTSTSGFATADSNLWTPFAIILLILGSLICACAGSTSGGMKANRALMALKMLYIRVKQQQHPNAVIRLKMDGVIQEAGVLHTVSLFIVAYLLLILIGTILCTLFGVDLMTSFSGCVASIGNVGPGFGGVNSMANYGDLPAIVKFIFTALMLLGRLEIFGLLQFLLIRWWK